MSHFYILLDPDPTVRDHFLSTAVRELSCQDGMIVERRECGDLGVVWAAGVNARISLHQDSAGFCLILGEAFGPCGRGTGPVDTWDLAASRDPIPAYDGFHLVVRFDGRSLEVGGDHLGIFPIHYLEGNGVVCLASSPKLLFMNLGAHRQIDPEGLAGILLTRGVYGTRTLWSGIRRVAAGALARVAVGQAVHEVPRTILEPLADSDKWQDLDLDSTVEILGETLRRSTAAYRSLGDGYQLLSGGLDSRMVAGFLRETGGCHEALTFGGALDIEYRVARKVANHLSYRQHRLQEPWDKYPETASWIADWEQLGAGFAFSFVPGLAMPASLARIGPRAFTGFLLDYIVGGTDIDPQDHPLDADSVFEKCHNHNGLSLPVLERILHPGPVLEAARDIAGAVKEQWKTSPGSPYQKAWLAGLPLRERHHVGVNLWRMSFSSWPATNALDLDVLRTCLSLPGKWMIARAAQKELVIRRFPDLAALPLDRNSFDSSPLVGGGARRLASLTGRIRRKMKTLTGWESRYYFRAYDLDARQWKAIRSRAEPQRDLMGSIFRRDALREILPAPRSPMKYMSDRIGHAGPLKLLVGLMLLADPSLAGGLSGLELYSGD